MLLSQKLFRKGWKMVRKTTDEVSAEISTLEAMKLNVRPFSWFGDYNHAAIDAQLEVLRERMSEDAVYEAYGDETADEFDQHLLDSAHHAYLWMSGENDNSPSSDWKPLVE